MRRFLIALALLAFPLNAAPAQDVARMEQIVRAEAEQGRFMGAVLVAKGDQILLDKGYGAANLEWNVRNDGATKFRLGSITKQFTAVAALLLQERGKLSLDAPIKTYLADAPAAWDKVTLRHLLNHSAGVPNFTALADYEQSKTRPATLASLIARFRDKPLEFAPGAQMNYSNSGYILLGAVIEKVSGQSYGDFVRDNIFKPLAMADSGGDSHALVLPRRASGYSPGADGKAIVNADYIDMTIPHAAGALYSTTRDLLKWQRALFGGRVLGPPSMKAFLQPYQRDYALGVFVQSKDGATIVSHGGGIEGFNTWLGHEVESATTVVVLGNLNSEAPMSIGGWLMTVALGRPLTLPSERQALSLPRAQLIEYAGTYQFSPQFSITVRVEGDAMTAQATGQAALPLFAEKRDEFFLRAVDARISFTRGASGRIEGMVLHQGGVSQPAKKQ